MKLIPQQITWTCIVIFELFGAAALRANDFPPTCLPPSGIAILSSSSVSIAFSWPANGISGATYEWEIGLPAFTPGNNEFIFHQTTTDTFGFAYGLVSGTALKLYLRTICGPGDTSAWSDPIPFTTAPGCNDVFTDPGGVLGNYPNGIMDTALICPPTDSEVVQLTFFTFATQALGDYLKLYDGTDASAPQIANLSGVFLPPFEPLPGPYTATNASGCLYALFFSNTQLNDEGWTALVSCTTPDSCLALSGLTVDSIGASSVQISWMPSFGAQHYMWELGVVPYDPGGTPIQADTSALDTLVLTGLSSNTHYILYVRSQCDSTHLSNWVSVEFFTPVSCGDTLYDSGGPSGPYGNDESLITTICPDSGNHTVTLTFLDFQTQAGHDFLSVYEGTDTLAPLAITLNGIPAPAPVLTATNATGCLTLRFVSDSDSTRNGWSAVVGCDTATDCYTLLDLTLDFISKDSAALSWTPIFGALGYIWELDTVPFNPGTGMSMQSDTSNANHLNLSGLISGHSYFVYVRSLCAADTSAWFGPLQFSTPPGCGDQFYDSGGAAGAYGHGEDYETLICPDSAGHVVTLSFSALNFGSGDTLRLYNGDSIHPLLLLGVLSGTPPLPAPYTATVSGGCITANFHSDNDSLGTGWAAGVGCAPPLACNDVLFPYVDSVSGTTAVIQWFGVAGAISYEWKLGPITYVPGGTPALDSGIVATNPLTLNGLDPLSNYKLWLRTICANDTTDFAVSLNLNTTVDCFSGAVILCGDTSEVTVSGIGDWALLCDTLGGQAPAAGKETVFIFTAPVTKTYQFLVDSVSGGYMDFYFKEISGGCNPTNWNCIGAFNQKDTAFIGPLVAGASYFVLADPEQTTPITARFSISDCTPLNNEPSGAIHLEVNEPCLSNIHANTTATIALNEPDPDVQSDPADTISGRWKNAVQQSVWFKFEAPASGTVSIITEGLSLSGNFDTRLALYETTAPADFSTFRYLDSDDDNGTSSDSLNSALYYTGLTGAGTYYIQVDGNSPSPGAFCIQVLDGIYRYHDGTCATAYSRTNVSGLATGSDRWYGIYGGQTQFAQGKLMAAVKPGQQNLDTVVCHLQVYSDSIPVSSNNVPYMPAYFKLGSSTAPAHPVQLRIFFYNYELNALKLKTGLLSNTADDLNISHYAGPNPDCTPVNHSTSSVDLLDTLVVAVPTDGTGSFYLDFVTDEAALGEFGAHFGSVALPVELKSFTGTARQHDNMLEWVTASEHQVMWHILERSADAISWTELGRLQGSLSAASERYYHLADLRPVPAAYYRIRAVDTDGKNQFSNAIMLIRRSAGIAVMQAFPSPTSDQLNVQVASPEEREALVRVFDIGGRPVFQQTVSLLKGVTAVQLHLAALPAGVYTLFISDSSGAAEPARIVKQ